MSCKDMREVAANMHREEVMKVMQTWVRKLGPAVEWQQAMSGRHQELENFRAGPPSQHIILLCDGCTDQCE